MTADQSVILISIDWPTMEVTLYRSDGAVGTAMLTTARTPDRIKTTTWSPHLDVLLIETTEGDKVEIELSRFDQSDQLDNRLVVYLDQCIWRRMADALHNPAALRPPELAAAEELISLVGEREIVLPLCRATLPPSVTHQR